MGPAREVLPIQQFKTFRPPNRELAHLTAYFLLQISHQGRAENIFRISVQGGGSLFVYFEASRILPDKIFKGNNKHFVLLKGTVSREKLLS